MPCTSERPEPGTDADFLGGKERIEDALEHLRRDTAAGIAHVQPYISAAWEVSG